MLGMDFLTMVSRNINFKQSHLGIHFDNK